MLDAKLVLVARIQNFVISRAAEGFELVESGSRSQDFGVTGKSSPNPAREREDDK
jgi:hypothetical protein